ncbi:hypothetical protein PHYBLDRAFT_143544 [Phycomyces blakesleeanus NRRL 1555(-)]|uniref:Uncharacterized protein n=1 Tax=Phycomyces blakesleeanus (strain ATCC 8743b / DSM 1359 / FGSC 10004 / NBRC 33097 / NRRL 1555) TaxID=763407 RepID=A0A162PRD2_PHYB8|nr:hypothetical protein PHYBLDRAFT_143544 [Phycomyces blakesleeanus NRRL 1555(-)]OAD75287.1 hypothetical protein PHYBLDRAFT_143544 [Phycomyces blakesleeanus NRRL 1555(-)]|eukprot:XP_018293327.1 hypothetical protein PHYBLDRAFT_143544 [Phycomyces blakesleeanus NRRL 1555(-)]
MIYHKNCDDISLISYIFGTFDPDEITLFFQCMILPPDYISLRKTIGKGFPYMKADEWKTSCLVYRPILLQGRLPGAYLDNWTAFTNACQYLAKPSISNEEIDEAHNFERFNGTIKNYSTNRRDRFENTYMRRYIEDTYKGDLVCSLLPSILPAYANILLDLSSASASASASANSGMPQFNLDAFINVADRNIDIIKQNEPLLPSAYPLALTDETGFSQSFVNNWIKKIALINLLGQVYQSSHGNMQRRSFIQACFCTDDEDDNVEYTGQIQYLFYMPTEGSDDMNGRIELKEFKFSESNFQNILPVHRLYKPVAVDNYRCEDGITRMGVVLLLRKIYA